MNKLSKRVAAALAISLLSFTLPGHQAHATSINGTIDFAGSVQFDSTDLSLANSVTQWRDVFGNAGFSNVAFASGDFATIALGTQTTMATTWTFDPLTATPGLWSVGGFTYDLQSGVIISQTSTLLHITGTGTVSGNGFDATMASWDFRVQNDGALHTFFSFSGETVASSPITNPPANGVPDSGCTIALMLGALGTLAAFRAKLGVRS